MNCLSDNLIQAFIDGEGTEVEKAGVIKHLGLCSDCRKKYEQHLEANEFCSNALESYAGSMERIVFQKPLAPIIPLEKHMKPQKGVTASMKPYKKYLLTACALGLIVTGLTMEPVRAAVGDLVSIFRAESIKSVDISLGDLKQLEEAISTRQGEINIENLAEIKQNGGEYKNISATEAQGAVTFKLSPLAGLKDAVPTEVSVMTAQQIDFTLNIDNVNSLMGTLGAEKLFNKNLDGKTFSIQMPATLTMNYNNEAENKYISYSQTKMPQIMAPEGTNVTDLIDAVSSLGILPAELQSKLKSMKDMDQTLYLPNVNNSVEEMSINGLMVFGNFEKTNDNQIGYAIWLEDGILKHVSGNFDKAELEQMIKGAK